MARTHAGGGVLTAGEDDMTVTARTAVLLCSIGLCSTGLSADAAKDAWKKCSKANETETKLRECSIAIESGTLSKDVVADALLFRASAYDERGDYDQAIKDLDESVRVNPLAFRSFNNRGWDYVRKFDYQRAIQDFNQTIQLSPKDDYAYANRGIAQFLSGDFAAAESDFAESQRLAPKPVRPYPALERILARLRGAKEKGIKPDANAVKFEGDLTQWPGPIVGFYMGVTSREAVLQVADAGFQRGQKWKLCQAYFFLGERALIDGKREEAMELLQKGIDTEAKGDPEYVWARGELRNLRNSDNGDITHEKAEISPNGQNQATGNATVQTLADSRTNVVPRESEAERHAADPAAIHQGSSTREEVRRDWACCDAHVVSDRLFVGTVHLEHGQIKYLFVEFDEKGIVSKTHLVSPDDIVPEAVRWARTTPEPLDLSRPMALTPSIIVFAGWRVRYFSGPITLYPDGLHIGAEALQLKPSQLSKFRQCGALKISLHHTCTGFGAFGVDVDAETPGTQLDVSGLSGIDSHLHILMKVPDLFVFVRYLRQTAPKALGGDT